MKLPRKKHENERKKIFATKLDKPKKKIPIIVARVESRSRSGTLLTQHK
jgi:hypothetical protein